MSLRIKKEFRRGGMATQLFHFIEEFAKKKNCAFICLFAEKENEIANQFYQSLGYEKENGYLKILN